VVNLNWQLSEGAVVSWKISEDFVCFVYDFCFFVKRKNMQSKKRMCYSLVIDFCSARTESLKSLWVR